MIFPKTVGVAPGTTTMQFGATRASPRSMYDSCCDPYKPCCDELMTLSGLGAAFPERSQWYPIDPMSRWSGRLPLGDILPGATLPTRARIRWDIIGIVGGGSLIISMAIGLIASAIAK